MKIKLTFNLFTGYNKIWKQEELYVGYVLAWTCFFFSSNNSKYDDSHTLL